MLQLDNSRDTTLVYIKTPDEYTFVQSQLYPFILYNVAKDKTTAGLFYTVTSKKNGRQMQVSLPMRDYDIGFYVLYFYSGSTLVLTQLAYVSPNANTAIPQTTYDKQLEGDDNIYIYYDE